MKKISIGLILYNNEKSEIEKFVKFLFISINQLKEKKPYVQINLYLLNNGTGEVFFNIFEKLNISFSEIPSRGNIGFAAGMNYLMSNAFNDGAAYFLSVNPDGCFHWDCLAELASAAEKFPDDLIEAIQFPDEHPKIYNPFTKETPWATGGCLLVNKQIYNETKGFDEIFFMYVEDVDLSWRVRLSGRKVRVADKAIFGHSPCNSVSKNALKFALISGLYLGKKWGSEKFINECSDKLKQLFNIESSALTLKNPPTNWDIKKASKSGIPNFSKSLDFAFRRWYFE